MLITVDGVEYLLTFRHNNPQKVSRFDQNDIPGTRCIIMQRIPGSNLKDELAPLGVGSSVLCLSDQFNYEIGRKVAFTRALDDAFPTYNTLMKQYLLGHQTKSIPMPDLKRMSQEAEVNKILRRAFWNAYRGRTSSLETVPANA